MYPLYKKLIKKRLKQLSLFVAISLFMVWVYAWMYPQIAGSAQQLDDMMQAFPQEFLKAFNIESTTAIFSSFEGFLTSEYFSFMWPLLVIILAVSLGSRSVAGEIEDGTMQVLLAQPISRTKLYFTRVFEGLTILTLFVGTSIGSIPLFGHLFGSDVKGIEYVLLMVLSLLFAYSIYAVTVLISAFARTRGIVSGSIFALIVCMYLINVVSGSLSNFEYIKYASFFNYYDYSGVLFDNHLSIKAVVIFVAAIVGSITIGWRHFKSRDV